MSDVNGPPPAKKLFEFKKSALSARADQMWNDSKQGFALSASQTHIQLEKKTLDDVLGKMAAEKKEKDEKQSKPEFIFGSKIAERVVTDNLASSSIKDEAKNTDGDLKSPVKTSCLGGQQTPDDAPKEKQAPSTSVLDLKTGEEGEDIVYQTACKIHTFDKDKKSWVERGLSNIRINRSFENGAEHHRIVARTSGTQKVIINSNIFADMMLERPDQKRIKLSGTGPESTQVQIFLVTIGFSKTDLNMDKLYETLTSILSQEKSASESRKRKAVVDAEVSPKKASSDAHVQKTGATSNEVAESPVVEEEKKGESTKETTESAQKAKEDPAKEEEN